MSGFILKVHHETGAVDQQIQESMNSFNEETDRTMGFYPQNDIK